VIVLFLFGIMLTRAPMRRSLDLDNNQRLPALAVAVLLFGVLAGLLGDSFGSARLPEAPVPTTSGLIGEEIFRVYVIPFEVVSMLLLAALIGSIVLARRD
jgi:NADH-quinone oxidoreductase subunit J